VAPEGVVNALRRIHAVLVPGGVVVDTQPVSARPRVEAEGTELGTLDIANGGRPPMPSTGSRQRRRRWPLRAQAERRFIVADTADDGPALVDALSGWHGTSVPGALARRIAAADPPISVYQHVRLRLLRALPSDA
jgi:hypothetical protein